MKRLYICLSILFFISNVYSRNGTYLKQDKLIINQTNQTNHTNHTSQNNHTSHTNLTNQTNTTNQSVIINETVVPRIYFV